MRRETVKSSLCAFYVDYPAIFCGYHYLQSVMLSIEYPTDKAVVGGAKVKHISFFPPSPCVYGSKGAVHKRIGRNVDSNKLYITARFF